MQMVFMHLLIYYCKQCENIQDVCLLKVNDNYLLWRIMNERQSNGGDVQTVNVNYLLRMQMSGSIYDEIVLEKEDLAVL